MNTIDGIIEDLELEDSCVGGCTTKGEIIECLENLKILQKEKETVLKALEDVRANTHASILMFRNEHYENKEIATGCDKLIESINDYIDRKIKEIKHE